MKVAKATLLAMALVAMLFSLSPLVATDYQDYSSGGGSGGNSSWQVTCTYNGQEQLLSKSCTSGGRRCCNCP